MIILLVGSIVVGASIGYSISTQIAHNQILEELNKKISNMESNIGLNITNFEVRFADIEDQIEVIQNQLTNLNDIFKNMSNWSTTNNATEDILEKANRFNWLTNLIYDLEVDTTDTNPRNNFSYDDEHYARDLEDNLESKGYTVSYIILLYMTNNMLNWDTLVKVIYSDDYYVFIDPQTDAIVTEKYDGDDDGRTESILNPSISLVQNWIQTLVNTSMGNDGEYLVFEFNDYETARLFDTRVYKSYEDLMKDLEEDTTDQNKYVEDTHDCDDFAEELEDALEKKGYRVTIKLIYWEDKDGDIMGHAVNDVYLDDGRVVTIEPQTDEDVTSVYDDDGDGEVETAEDVGWIRSQLWLTAFDYLGIGATDGKYLIFEYEDRDDVPFDLD